MELLRPGHRWPRIIATVLLAWGTGVARARDVSAEDLKAVFLLRFGNFTEWPAPTPSSPSQPFVIGILGTDPFGPRLDHAIRGEAIGDRPITIARFRHISDVRGCSILFISASEAPHLPAVLAALRGRPILTVSDIEGFARAGGMVHFYPHQSRVRLRVNLDAVRGAGLTISSKLLRAAEIVQEGVVVQP